MNITEGVILLLLIVSLFFSWNKYLLNNYSRSFDIPLINKYEDLRQKGDYKAIISISTQYLQQAKENNYKDGEALCYAVMSSINIRAGKYKEAMPLYLKARQALSTSENDLIKAFCFNEFSRLHLIVDLYAYALDYNSRAIYYSKKISDPKTKIFLLNKAYLSQGIILDVLNKNDSALVYLHKGLKIKYTPVGDTFIAQHHLFYTKNIDSIGLHIKHALKMLPPKSESIDASLTYSIAGAYYREIKDFKTSKEYHLKALKILEDKPDFLKSNSYVYVYADLTTLANRENNEKEKQYYFVKVNQAKENLEWDRPDIVSLLNANFTSEAKEKDKKNIILYIISAIVLLVLFSIFIYWRVRLLKGKKELLEDGIEDLKLRMEDKLFGEIIELAKKNDSAFLLRFADLYPDFVSKLQKINPDLENSEIAFCAMLKLNFSSKELAQILTIQHVSVQKKKSRIRKRLGISSDEDIYDFFNRLT
ncbi:hypothetical protein QWZ06_16975 [Chryseobacterium tructae]|uniref:helix-turn-helix transcriptional regulator n=1 Tax=Chryseobacterium tructae TaxID=1037380 RepID=UPI0025B5BDE1|nr:hypothetical protein [Chryseobacterium tructae]MDN3693859.1 hypothetical protein [Chryseobacterium tructae]